ncbi:hypothetical protein Tsubulata_009907 [Turnera subulata]|uniref:VQ domain-containing protein n=1 Tax=Turnera subulata TaxID=218843 RepID=A0A9Q0JFT2_9ROSI|nr:hypothetical protein Tsubulata_009907 [Turnera subulata]
MQKVYQAKLVPSYKVYLDHRDTKSMTRQLHLEGLKSPAGLMVSRSSTKIKKSLASQSRSPVIVYLKSPDVIHVRPEEFMGLVQRLTGKQAAESLSASSSLLTSYRMRLANDAPQKRYVSFSDGQGRRSANCDESPKV